MIEEHSTETIGKRIEQLRKLRGFTQKELADLVGASQSTVSQYENDKTPPPLYMVRELARVLSVPIAYLLHGEGTQQPLPRQLEKTILEGLGYLEQKLQREGAVDVVRAELNQLITTTRKHIDEGAGLSAQKLLFDELVLLVKADTRAHNTDLRNDLPLCDKLMRLAKELSDEEGHTERVATATVWYADVMLQLGRHPEAVRLAKRAREQAQSPTSQAEPQRTLMKALHKSNDLKQLKAEWLVTEKLLPKLPPWSHEKWCLLRTYAYTLSVENPLHALTTLKDGWKGFLQLTQTGVLKDDLLGTLYPVHIAQVAYTLGGQLHGLARFARHVAFLGMRRSEKRYQQLHQICTTIAARAL